LRSGLKEDLGFEGDPVKAIKGALKDVDASSVELQHRAEKYWIEDVSH